MFEKRSATYGVPTGGEAGGRALPRAASKARSSTRDGTGAPRRSARTPAAPDRTAARGSSRSTPRRPVAARAFAPPRRRCRCSACSSGTSSPRCGSRGQESLPGERPRRRRPCTRRPARSRSDRRGEMSQATRSAETTSTASTSCACSTRSRTTARPAFPLAPVTTTFTTTLPGEERGPVRCTTRVATPLPRHRTWLPALRHAIDPRPQRRRRRRKRPTSTA